MLEAVTKKYIDSSTEEQFEYSFFCDCCGKNVSTTRYSFKPGFAKKFFLSRTEQRAREIIWQRDHDSAYERANIEALKILNRCVLCGAVVCGDCTVECEETGGKTVCLTCAKEHRYRGVIWKDNDETVSVDFGNETKTSGIKPHQYGGIKK